MTTDALIDQGAEEPIAEAVEAEDVVYTIGEEEQDEGGAADEVELPEEERSSDVIRALRKQAREAEKLQKELRQERKVRAELEAKVKAVEPPKPALPPKPTIADHDYKTAEYEAALEKWIEQKRVIDAQEEADRTAKQAVEREWQDRLQGFDVAKKGLKVADYDDAEDAVKRAFGVERFAATIALADKPEHLVYALGRNAKEAQRLSAIKDPAKFVYELAKLEQTMKATPRKPETRPETPVVGSVKSPIAAQARLEKLLEQARNTGDYSAYRAAQKAIK